MKLKCQKCQESAARETATLGLLNDAQGRIVDLEAALISIQAAPANIGRTLEITRKVLEHTTASVDGAMRAIVEARP